MRIDSGEVHQLAAHPVDAREIGRLSEAAYQLSID